MEKTPGLEDQVNKKHKGLSKKVRFAGLFAQHEDRKKEGEDPRTEQAEESQEGEKGKT